MDSGEGSFGCYLDALGFCPRPGFVLQAAADTVFFFLSYSEGAKCQIGTKND